MTTHDKATLAVDADSLRTIAKLVERRGRKLHGSVPDGLAKEIRQISEHLKRISGRMKP